MSTWFHSISKSADEDLRLGQGRPSFFMLEFVAHVSQFEIQASSFHAVLHVLHPSVGFLVLVQDEAEPTGPSFSAEHELALLQLSELSEVVPEALTCCMIRNPEDYHLLLRFGCYIRPVCFTGTERHGAAAKGNIISPDGAHSFDIEMSLGRQNQTWEAEEMVHDTNTSGNIQSLRISTAPPLPSLPLPHEPTIPAAPRP